MGHYPNGQASYGPGDEPGFWSVHAWPDYANLSNPPRLPSLPASVPGGRMSELRLNERSDADRIAYHGQGGMSFDISIKRFPSREALVRTIRRQESQPAHYLDWRAIVPLGISEGY